MIFYRSEITIKATILWNNRAARDGGVLFSYDEANIYGVRGHKDSNITIHGCIFYNNSAIENGGVLYSSANVITIEASHIFNNNATSGGALYSQHDSFITVKGNVVYQNNAAYGGVLYSETSNITLDSCNFTHNRSPIGAVIYAIEHSKLQCKNYLLFDSNSADIHGVMYFADSQLDGNISSSFIFSNNLGSLVALNSNITFNGCATFENNTPLLNASDEYLDGRAVTVFQGNETFNGGCSLDQSNTEIQILPSICLVGVLNFSFTLLSLFV